MIPVFILTYSQINYMTTWFNPASFSDNVRFYIIDNGNQTIPSILQPYVIHTTSVNIGCSGGWNLMFKIAFYHFGFDKIISAQDDAICDESMYTEVYNKSNETTLCGAYDRSFEFAVFGIHKKLYETVGEVDENLLFAGCEDNDYKKRIALCGCKVIDINKSANLNRSLTTTSNPSMFGANSPSGEYNRQYIEQKWGKQYEFNTPYNDPNLTHKDCPVKYGYEEVYSTDKFLSDFEYERFSKAHQS